jgi:phage-related protein
MPITNTQRQAPGGSIYGPRNDRNLYIKSNSVKEIEVPKKYKAVFEPQIDPSAAYAQAFCVYSVNVGDETYTKIIDGTNEKVETPINDSDSPMIYYFTGWYKNGSDPWNQSKMLYNNQQGVVTVKFDDGYDDRDYNDLIVTISLIKE